MKAIVRHAYGSPDVLQLEELHPPTPGDDDLLIRVRAVSLNLGDWELLTGKPLFIALMASLFAPATEYKPVSENGPRPRSRGLFKPRHKILGTDISGVVEAVGGNVSGYQPGDKVFGMCMFGGLAEYICVPQAAGLAHKPPEMSFVDAAALPQAAFIAIKAMRDRPEAQAGRRVLINGAGGGAGTLALQLAKMQGAEVTGVDNGLKQEMMRELGADRVIDYTREDHTRSGGQYDLILDLAAHRSIFDSRPLLSPDGLYLMAGGAFLPTVQAALLGPWVSRGGKQRMEFLLADSKTEDLDYIAELYTAGTVLPIVDRTVPLAQVAEAFRMIGAGEAKGKVVITL